MKHTKNKLTNDTNTKNMKYINNKHKKRNLLTKKNNNKKPKN